MPIYEFSCEACGARFEDLVPAGTETIACPQCGARRTRRVLSAQAESMKLVKPPGERRRQERANARLNERARASFKDARTRARERTGKRGRRGS